MNSDSPTGWARISEAFSNRRSFCSSKLQLCMPPWTQRRSVRKCSTLPIPVRGTIPLHALPSTHNIVFRSSEKSFMAALYTPLPSEIPFTELFNSLSPDGRATLVRVLLQRQIVPVALDVTSAV